jgi:hypothetical protein
MPSAAGFFNLFDWREFAGTMRHGACRYFAGQTSLGAKVSEK